MKTINTKKKKKTKDEYLQENCEICNNRFTCELFKKAKKCYSFDDVFTH